MSEINVAINYIDSIYKELLRKFQYKTNDDGTYTILGVYKEYLKEDNYKVVVPPNTKIIGVQAFDSLYIEEVILPDGLEEIDNYAFHFCSNLKKINFPSSLKRIGKYAFYNCSRLEEIVLPEGLEEICDEAFASCILLEKVIIPKSVISIGSGAFDRCMNLHYILTDLKEKPDGWDENFYEEFAVSYYKTLEVIYGSTVVPNIDLSYEVVLAKDLEDYEYDILEDGTYEIIGIKNIEATDLIIPGNVSIIGDGAFYNNRNIRKVVVSEGVKVIKSEAFDLCTNLLEIELPESLTQVDFRVFNRCRYLQEVVFHKNLKWVQSNSFWGCTCLENIYVKSEELFNKIYKNVDFCKAKVSLKK